MNNSKRDALQQVLDRIPNLAPVTYIVRVQGTLAVALNHYAMEESVTPETVMVEALRAYLGDAA